jgi:hypothetical protein
MGRGIGAGGGFPGDDQGGGGGDFPADDSAGGGGDGSGDSAGGGGEADPFGEGAAGGGGGQGGDEEFDKSLGDFDREMGREQDEIAKEGGGPAADSTVARDGGGAGDTAAGAGGNAGGGNSAGGGDGSGEGGAAIRDLGPDPAAAMTVEGCNDQDRVARQLCEAATKEADPFLRAALWDEYNEYKKLVARD